MEHHIITYRNDVVDRDKQSVRTIVESSGFFSAEEADVAVELVQERLIKGSSSGYSFLFAVVEDRTVGYSCFGPIACTVGSYALYWLAVENARRREGIGTRVLQMTEEIVFEKAGGRRLYVETSSRAQYEPTRRFYRSCGYREEGVLSDFYAPSDDKVIYVKMNA